MTTEIEKMDHPADIPVTRGLSHLDDVHRWVARMEVEGYRITDIQGATNLDPDTIHQIRFSPLYQAYLGELRKEKRDVLPQFDGDEEVGRLRVKAFSVVENLMDTSEKDMVRLSAAKEILDRSDPKITRNRDESLSISLDGKTLVEALSMMNDGGKFNPTSTPLPEIIDILEADMEADPKNEKGHTDIS